MRVARAALARRRRHCAQDGGIFSKATSDPYVKVFVGGDELARTSVVNKNLNPEWNEKVLAGHMVGGAKVAKDPTVTLCVFDQDKCSADDPMGEVRRFRARRLEN